MRLLRYRNVRSLLQVEVHLTSCVVYQPPLPPDSELKTIDNAKPKLRLGVVDRL